MSACQDLSTVEEVVWLETAALRSGPSLRAGGLDSGHVAALAEMDGRWPPIVVRGGDNVIVDGRHRVAAAGMLGRTTVAAVWFHGTDEDLYAEAVRRNVEHGLPLTIDERKGAAGRLLANHARWSDRRIAGICGLSARTVARLRTAGSDGAGDGSSEIRVGRDGRLRSMRPESTRERILEAVKASPEASLRAIARAVGTSPETVRRVRQRAHNRSGQSIDAAAERVAAKADLVAVGDPALASRSDGHRFASWFKQTSAVVDWTRHVEAMPLSRIYEVADEARRRADAWTHFAEAVETRVRPAGLSNRS
jgi:ParB-like chromosome segregation protein Spo0J